MPLSSGSGAEEHCHVQLARGRKEAGPVELRGKQGLAHIELLNRKMSFKCGSGYSLC